MASQTSVILRHIILIFIMTVYAPKFLKRILHENDLSVNHGRQISLTGASTIVSMESFKIAGKNVVSTSFYLVTQVRTFEVLPQDHLRRQNHKNLYVGVSMVKCKMKELKIYVRSDMMIMTIAAIVVALDSMGSKVNMQGMRLLLCIKGDKPEG